MNDHQSKTYQWVLFDADETLFHFDVFAGLRLLFFRFGIGFTKIDYIAYRAHTKALWSKYQNGEITANQLKIMCFSRWTKQLALDDLALYNAFLNVMSEICTPIAGARALLNALHGKIKLGLITNGLTELQAIRLKKMGFAHHFEFISIAEEVGAAKPHPAIFNHAFAQMSSPPREQVLMVGDNLHTDILGGINAGIDTCWLNREHLPLPKDIKPHYHITALPELQRILLGS